MKYGPAGGCPFAIPTMTVAAANATNVSSLCPGLTPDQVTLEHEKIVAAARFYSTASVNDPTTGSGNDIGFDGCARKVALANFQAKSLTGSLPDVLFYDWEGWTDMEHWVANVQTSENAQRQRLPDETQCVLKFVLCLCRPILGLFSVYFPPKIDFSEQGRPCVSHGLQLVRRPYRRNESCVSEHGSAFLDF